jgi:hypothetical protein
VFNSCSIPAWKKKGLYPGIMYKAVISLEQNNASNRSCSAKMNAVAVDTQQSENCAAGV